MSQINYVDIPRRPIKGRAVCGHARRRARSWPFDTLIGAICPTCRALSDAPISVANGRDLGPLRASSKVHENPPRNAAACQTKKALRGKLEEMNALSKFT